jgi:long-subunit fatty acid transport protein
MKRLLVIGFSVLMLASGVTAQGMRTPSVSKDPDLKYATGFGPSVGWVLDEDKWFWGVAWDVGYSLSERWSVAGALAYDQEVEERATLADKKINTFTGTATVAYGFTERFSVTTGLGLGFLDDDNAKQRYQFTNGDLGTGLVLGYAFPWGADRSFALSGAYEWNLTSDEATVSVDAGVALAF